MWLVGGTQDSFTWALRGPIHRLLREVAKHPVLLPHSHTEQVPVEQSSLLGHLKQWVPAGGGELPDSLECRSQPSSLGCYLLLPQSTEAHVCVNRRPDWCMCGREGSFHLSGVTPSDVSAVPAYSRGGKPSLRAGGGLGEMQLVKNQLVKNLPAMWET